MKKFLLSGLVTLLTVLTGCDHDVAERSIRKDKEEVPNVTVVQKKAFIGAEKKTYDQAQKEQKELHKQIQHDMDWDLRHKTWHAQYPIHTAPVIPTVGYQSTPAAVNVYQPPSQAPPPAATQQTAGSLLPSATDGPPVKVGSKKAVIVGINAYPGCALKGCVNDAMDIMGMIKYTASDYQQFNPSSTADAEAIKAWLTTNMSFTDNDIVFLRDADATTANILKALVWLTADTKAGDERLFWYSGHGAEFAGTDIANQPDHQNQVMCPVDFAWDLDHMITDVQLHNLLATMPNGVIFNWGSDSCHSGDLDRAIPKRNITYRRWPLPPPANVAANLAKVKRSRGIPHRGIVAGELDVGFLSGCQYDEFSADTQDDTGRPCGAMTQYFQKVIKTSGNWNKPLTTLAAEENKILDSYKYDQHPQPEGARKNKGWMQN